ncbi:MAG: tail fiber assembly protein [Enterobacteriaceae bacterium]
MSYVYSETTNAFYAVSLQSEYEAAGSWPADGIGVDDEIYQQFSVPPPLGKIRGTSKKGVPCWVDLPPLTAVQVIESATAKKQSLLIQANTAIAPLQDAVDLNVATAEETQRLTDWKLYRIALNRVNVNDGDNIDWPGQPES